jgi:hypothetical protein
MDLNNSGINLAKDAGLKASTVDARSIAGKFDLSNVVSLKSHYGRFLSAQPNGSTQWDSDQAGEWEKISLEAAGDGKYGLKSVHNKYLSAQPNGSVEWNRDKLDIWETWAVEERGNGIALRSYHGKYLSAQPDGRVEANSNAIGERETVVVVNRRG